MRYTVTTTPVTELLRPQLLAEAGELRLCIRKVEDDLAVKRAWAQTEERSREAEYLKWRANALTFLGKLAYRYAEIREQLRQRRV